MYDSFRLNGAWKIYIGHTPDEVLDNVLDEVLDEVLDSR